MSTPYGTSDMRWQRTASSSAAASAALSVVASFTPSHDCQSRRHHRRGAFCPLIHR
jgi:hypothetical protein